MHIDKSHRNFGNTLLRQLLISTSAFALVAGPVFHGSINAAQAQEQAENTTPTDGEINIAELDAAGIRELLVVLRQRAEEAAANEQDPTVINEQIAALEARLAELEAAEQAAANAAQPAAQEQAAQQPAAAVAAEEAPQPAPQAEVQEAAPQQPEGGEGETAAASADEAPAAAADSQDSTSTTEQAEAQPAADPAPEAQAAAPVPAADQQAAPQAEPQTAQQAEPQPEPQPMAAQTTEEQAAAVEKAAEEPVAVVSDEASAEQLAALQAAEEQRRSKAREDRLKLLGAAAVGVAVGTIIPQLGGRVVGDEGDRIYIERDGELIVQKDENALLRSDGAEVISEQIDATTVRETIVRTDGTQVITDRDVDTGEIIYRSRIRRDGTEVVLIDNREFADVAFEDRQPVELPLSIERLPLSSLVVEAEAARQEDLRRALEQERIIGLERVFDLRTVRENENVRSLVKRIDLSNVTFASGSFAVREAEVRKLGALANAMINTIDDDPRSLFLIEGHTDAVGGELYNLDLSDRRAETVARILINAYGVPAENLITQGYGERYLKVNTQEDNQANRRVTVRNISPLIARR
jgi:outer membrane protein OmpA-like peptidoglycan-associated protein